MVLEWIVLGEKNAHPTIPDQCSYYKRFKKIESGLQLTYSQLI